MNDLVVILTALDLEYRAVRDTLTDLRLRPHPAGTRFEVGRIDGSNCRVALVLVGKGNHPAAVLTERAIAEFDPAAVLFVGVAGALWPKVDLGDVVVATHVYAYHGGTSEDDGLKARPRVWEISHRADQIAQHVARTGDWARTLPPGSPIPRVRFGPIAAGEIVQDSTVSDHARWIREHYNDALAVEMEAAGVAQAAHLNDSLPVIVVRGISDRADGTKATTDAAQWQPKAAARAAAFAIAVARELIKDQHYDDPGPGRAVSKGGPNTGVTNIATGNARVGVQAGQVIGDIRIAPESRATADLATLIADFRQQLGQARRADLLDEGTYQAAQAELNVVAQSLSPRTEQNDSRLMLALKKLRGLIADVADLAAKVAAIITAAKAMSCVHSRVRSRPRHSGVMTG
jgi:adenosylhomocysteine nucleosidase